MDGDGADEADIFSCRADNVKAIVEVLNSLSSGNKKDQICYVEATIEGTKAYTNTYSMSLYFNFIHYFQPLYLLFQGRQNHHRSSRLLQHNIWYFNHIFSFCVGTSNITSRFVRIVFLWIRIDYIFSQFIAALGVPSSLWPTFWYCHSRPILFGTNNKCIKI